MGATASVSRVTCYRDFDSLEQICSTSYYKRYPEQYKAALYSAIESSSLDAIEILIPAGDIEEAQPVHMAASMAKLDALEILISAGLNISSQNAYKETPLHCAARNLAVESSLCSLYLVLTGGPKLLHIKNSEGLAPLELSIKENNIEVVRSLVLYDTAKEKVQQAVSTAKKLALMFKRENIFQFLNGIIDEEERKVRILQRHLIESKRRAVEIWEKFFENALNLVKETPRASAILSDSAHFDSKQVENIDSMYEEESNWKNQQQVDVHEWLDWILCYAPYDAGLDINCSSRERVEGYYFVSKSCSHRPRWLNEHLCDLFGIQSHVDDDGENVNYGIDSTSLDMLSNVTAVWNEQYNDYLPQSIDDLVALGWVIYYDQELNLCVWMRLWDGRTEQYLPLGDDDRCYDYAYDTFFRSHESPEWVYCFCDMICGARAWLTVNPQPNKNDPSSVDSESKSLNTTTEEEEGCDDDIDCYYVNRITGYASWTEPPGLRNEIERTGGWQLFTTAESNWDAYWFNNYTLESSWFDED